MAKKQKKRIRWIEDLPISRDDFTNSGFCDHLPDHLINRITHPLNHHRCDIETLVTRTETQLLRIPNIGPESIKHIKHALAQMGLKLKA